MVQEVVLSPEIINPADEVRPVADSGSPQTPNPQFPARAMYIPQATSAKSGPGLLPYRPFRIGQNPDPTGPRGPTSLPAAFLFLLSATSIHYR